MQMARMRSTPSPSFYFLLFSLLAYIRMISCEEEATIATSTAVCITDNQQLCTRLDRIERQLRLISASQLEVQGWTLYNLHWYRLFEVELTWSAAENYCRVYGGHLPSIHDVAENDFIHRLRKKNSVWIGLNKRKSALHQWSDGSAVDYINWDSTQPNQPNAKCVYMMYNQGTRGWFDYGCHEQMPQYFICKMRM